MSERDWKLFLKDILESITKIERYISELSFEAFMEDEKTKDAVVRNLEIIGEAANHIPRNIQERFHEIPWKQIIGMRNRLIYGYFVVDYTIVWEIVKNELPELRENIERILEGEREF